MNDFIAKPVRKKFLIQAIVRALAEREMETLRTSLAERGDVDRLESGSAEALFDRRAFEVMVAEISLEMAIHTFSIFVEDTRARLDAFAHTRISEDRDKVRIEAGALKSTAETFGFRRLATLADQLGQKSGSMAEGEFRSFVPEMNQAFASAMAEFASGREAA